MDLEEEAWVCRSVFLENTKETASGLASCPWTLPHSWGPKALGAADFKGSVMGGECIQDSVEVLALYLRVSDSLGFVPLASASPASALGPLSTCPGGTTLSHVPGSISSFIFVC